MITFDYFDDKVNSIRIQVSGVKDRNKDTVFTLM